MNRKKIDTNYNSIRLHNTRMEEETNITVKTFMFLILRY